MSPHEEGMGEGWLGMRWASLLVKLRPREAKVMSW